MNPLLSQIISRADGFRWYDELAAVIAKSTTAELEELVNFCAEEYLEHRVEILKILLGTGKISTDCATEALQKISEMFREDSKSQEVLISFGANADTQIAAAIYKFQTVEDLLRDQKEVDKFILAVKQRSPRAMLTPEEAIALVSQTFQDQIGQLMLIDHLAEKEIPWNIKAASSEIENIQDKTPFYYVVSENPKLAEKIVENFVETKKISIDWKVTDRYDRNLLYAALDSPKLFRKFLEAPHGVGENWINRKDRTPSRKPLLFAVAGSANYDKLLKPFLEKGADIEAKDKVGNTVLHYLYFRGLQQGVSVIDKLIDVVAIGIPVDITDAKGRTLLMSATAEEDLVAAKKLLEIGANPIAQTDSKSVIDLAEEILTQEKLAGFQSAVKKFFPRLKR